MNKHLANLALAACLACPALASATWHTPTSMYSDEDTYAFTLSSLSTVSIDYAWSDTLVTKYVAFVFPQATTEYNGVLTWALTKASATVESGSFSDVTGVKSGRGTLQLGNLAAGSYTLTINGVWSGVDDNSASLLTSYRTTVGSVNLLDGDGSNCSGFEKNTFSAAPVPEPETYAMLLAGLGLMGCVARRRRRA